MLHLNCTIPLRPHSFFYWIFCHQLSLFLFYTVILDCVYNPKAAHCRKVMIVCVCVSSGSSYYDNVRPLAYPDADAVLICFDVSRPETMDSVLKKVSVELKSIKIKNSIFNFSQLWLCVLHCAQLLGLSRELDVIF